jgi:hypothetical protein
MLVAGRATLDTSRVSFDIADTAQTTLDRALYANIERAGHKKPGW